MINHAAIDEYQQSIATFNFVQLEQLKENLTKTLDNFEKYKNYIEYIEKMLENNKTVALYNSLDAQLKKLVGEEYGGLESHVEEFNTEYEPTINKINGILSDIESRFDCDEYRNRTAIDIRLEYIHVFEEKFEDVCNEQETYNIFTNPFDLTYVKNRISSFINNKSYMRTFNRQYENGEYPDTPHYGLLSEFVLHVSMSQYIRILFEHIIDRDSNKFKNYDKVGYFLVLVENFNADVKTDLIKIGTDEEIANYFEEFKTFIRDMTYTIYTKYPKTTNY